MQCIRVGLRITYIPFLSFCLLSRILQNVWQERMPSMLLITSTWHNQSWYSSLFQMSIETPVILPRINGLPKDPLGKEHHFITNKTKVSGMKNLRERSSLSGVLRTASSLLLTQGEVHLQEILNRPGESRLAGVIGDKLIQFRVI